jgi:hypothetical protein
VGFAYEKSLRVANFEEIPVIFPVSREFGIGDRFSRTASATIWLFPPRNPAGLFPIVSHPRQSI